MRSISTAAIVCLLFGTATWAAAAPQSTSNHLDEDAVIADKNLHLSGNQHYDGNFVGGETIGTAVTINSIPYNDSGNTCGYNNDYDEVCPYSGSLSGDVVYKYTPGANVIVNINMCTSQYDTKLYVYEQAYTPGDPYACNDDAGCGITGYQSRINGLPLTGGYTYYIVVDGWNSDCGAYDISVGEPVPCIVCPPGAQLEGEPVCGPDYVDNYNGGCNPGASGFTTIQCNTVCAEAGTYVVNGTDQYRDVDWYTITVGAGSFTYKGIPDGFSNLNLWVFVPDCPTILGGGGLIGFTSTPDCTMSNEIAFNGPGTFYLVAAYSTFSGLPCGSRYNLFVNGPGIPECAAATGACCLPDRTCVVTTADECASVGGSYLGDNTACDPTTCQQTAVEPSTWGKIKSIYK